MSSTLPMSCTGHARPLVVEPNGRAWLFLPWLILLSAAIVGLIAPWFSGSAAAWPFLISAILVGMPHGALDLRLWLKREPTARQRFQSASLYLLILLAAGGVLALWPQLAIAGFGLLTVMHFGFADARQAARAVGALQPNEPSLWLIGVGRGAFLLAVPFAWSPVDAMVPVNLALTLTGNTGVSAGPALLRMASMAILAVALACLVLGVARTAVGSNQVNRPHGRETFEDLLVFHLIEVTLLAAAAAVLSPMFFVGTYFVGWHALRHFAEVQRQTDRPPGRLVPSLMDLHLRSLPLLLPTLAAYAALGWSLIGWRDPMKWATLLLLFFAVLTPSHHWLVERVHRRPMKPDPLR